MEQLNKLLDSFVNIVKLQLVRSYIETKREVTLIAQNCVLNLYSKWMQESKFIGPNDNIKIAMLKIICKHSYFKTMEQFTIDAMNIIQEYIIISLKQELHEQKSCNSFHIMYCEFFISQVCKAISLKIIKDKSHMVDELYNWCVANEKLEIEHRKQEIRKHITELTYMRRAKGICTPNKCINIYAPARMRPIKLKIA